MTPATVAAGRCERLLDTAARFQVCGGGTRTNFTLPWELAAPACRSSEGCSLCVSARVSVEQSTRHRERGMRNEAYFRRELGRRGLVFPLLFFNALLAFADPAVLLETTRLVPADGAPNGGFGRSVAIDGNIAVV